jgi:diadenosine tetraphosphate (Ap4A) HIT family hydrolase
LNFEGAKLQAEASLLDDYSRDLLHPWDAMENHRSHAPRPVQQVMVSSTYKDLQTHRAMLIESVHKHKLYANVMEHDDAKVTQDVIASSINMVRDSAAYILLIGSNYGQIPLDSVRNPDQVSITELEFKEAQELGRPTLLFIMGDSHPVAMGNVEKSRKNERKLKAFCKRAKRASPGGKVNRVYAVFESLEEFRAKIGSSLTNLCQHLAVSDSAYFGMPATPSKSEPGSMITPNLPHTGYLRTGRMWALVESAKKAIPRDRGYHLILQVPRNKNCPGENAYQREELKPEEIAELWLVAEMHANEFSRLHGRPGYYRIECNGSMAGSNNYLHFHIITGKDGVNFRRCVDPIEQPIAANAAPVPPTTEEKNKSYANALEKIEECRQRGDKVLELRYANLTRLPPEIGNLTDLETLDLTRNQLESLPPEIGKLGRLKELFVEDNRLSSLPPQIGDLSNLTILLLRNNRLSSLPPQIGNLGKLKKLRLLRNQLTSLPPEIGNLSELKWLGIPHNQLESLPKEIGLLKKLTMLRAFNNKLTNLPDEIGELDSLEEMYLNDNELEDLPISLKDLAQLKVLALHGNDKLELPYAVAGSTEEREAKPQEILAYYFGRDEQGEAPMQEVRLMLVGRSGVGKTSLLKALRGETLDTRESATAGISVLPIDLNCAQGAVRGHAWDFGGKEFLHATHQVFLSERCMYLLVLEGRESNREQEMDYWLQFIQVFGSNGPVIVALNKYDTLAFSVDRIRLKERCPQIVDFVNTDALTGLGIGKLRKLVEETANGMEDVWRGVPKNWRRVNPGTA